MNVQNQQRASGLTFLPFLALLFLLPGVHAQSLRFGNHREIKVPDYATIRIGPFYSDVSLSEEISYRYVRTTGRGSGYISDNRLGEIKKDGADYPIVSTLVFKNYLIISRTMDLEVALRVQYRYFPMNSQEDELIVDMSDEGIYADLSTEIAFSKTSKMRLYESAAYRTDYVDTRGWGDKYGGEEYEHFENKLGMDWDWLMSRDDNLGVSLARRDVVPTGSKFDRQRSFGYNESLSYGHRFSPFLSGGAAATLSQSFYGAGRPDAFMYGLSAFSSAQLTRKSSGRASLGYTLSETTGGEEESENRSRGSLSASLGVDTELSPGSAQSVGYSRRMAEAFQGGFDVVDTLRYTLNWRRGMFPGRFYTTLGNHDLGGGAGTSYVDWITGVSLTHRLTRLIGLEFLTSFNIRDNQESSSEGVSADASADYNTWITRLSLGLPVTEKTTCSAYVEHVERTSASESLEYSRDILGVSLSWSHRF